MCILLCKSTKYDPTGYISLVIKLNILNHMMILASADYSYRGLLRRRSLTCYVFTLFGCAIRWKTTLQSIVALSTTEVEYLSLTEGVKEGIWLHDLVDS